MGITIALLVIGIGSLAGIIVSWESEQLNSAARESTELLMNTIERSIFNSMRLGNTEDVKVILEMVGSKNHKLAAVRIFHPQGVVLKSARITEVGKPVRDEDYQLFVNNKKLGIFATEGGEVLSMVRPIYNDISCHTCHGSVRRVIGVLNVNFSLAETRQRLVAIARLCFALAAILVVVLSVTIFLVIHKFIKKPLLNMADTMAKVEEGDLSVRLRHKEDDEIGRLVSSFNSMVERLERAKGELEQYHYEQMERADRLASVGEMAAGIAHEIKNPLTGIAAAITILNDDFPEGDQRREIGNEVLEQVKRLDKTVNDLLYFGKPSEPEPTLVDLNVVVKKTLLFASQHRGGKNINKEIWLHDGLPLVKVDPKQIQQIFLNLILNAVQAMPDGGTLTIRSRVNEEGGSPLVTVSFADTGTGIPKQALAKIFTPFFTTKAQGTGLGLAICQKLVGQHGGRIRVTSEEGKGTVFTVEIPAAPLES
jgi:signal transduction histidine kinase